MNNVRRVLRIALVVMLASGGSVMAADPPVYENFKGKVFNAGRWLGGRVDIGVVEIRRKIKNNAMHMRVRGIADDATTTGDRHKVINRIWVDGDRAPSIRSFQTYVQVDEAAVVDCDSNDAANSRSEYQNLNIWFNNGESTGTDDRRGDVYTQLGLRKTNTAEVSADQLEIVAFIGRCADSNCDTSAALFTQIMGTYPIGSKIALRTTWDETRKEFRFYTRQQGVEPLSLTFDYAAVVNDGANTGTRNKRTHGIQVRSDAADCDMTDVAAPQPFGMMDVKVYNTRISDAPDGF